MIPACFRVACTLLDPVVPRNTAAKPLNGVSVAR